METIRIRKLSHANLGIECEDDLSAELREFFSFFVPSGAPKRREKSDKRVKIKSRDD